MKAAIDREAADAVHYAMYDPKVMVVGQTVYVAVTLAIYFFFKSVTPTSDMRLWTVIATAGLSLSLIFCAAFFIRRPDQAETLRFWRRIDKSLTHVFDVVAVASIFLLFQHGSEAQRMVALAFCVGYGPMQLIIDPENVLANRISVTVIMSAFSMQLFRMQHEAATILTVLFILYAGSLLYAAGVFYRSYEATVLQKIENEAKARKSDAAFQAAAASRDAKTRFIASVSHDLGHPLQAASLFANQLARSGGPDAESPALGMLKTAISEAQAQVSHILGYLRLEADAVQPSITRWQLGEVIRQVVNQHGIEAADRRVAIRVVASGRIVASDRQLVARALDNLVVNALTHAKATKLLVGARFRGSTIRLWVIDNGVGIPPHLQERVFDDFSQGSQTAASGFGIGLASVRRTVALLGGNAGIDGRWTKGCAAFMSFEDVSA